MNDQDLNNTPAVPSAHERPADQRGKPRCRRVPVLLCHVVKGQLEAVLVRPSTGDHQPAVEPWSPHQPLPARCRIISLLPRSQYLVRTLELPSAAASETAQMLRLEVEASLPREFGEAEVAYRLIEASSTNTQRYEVYAVRREPLTKHLETLQQHGIEPTHVLPTAVVWARYLSRGAAVDVVAVSTEVSACELASVHPNGQVASRTIHSTETDAAALQTGLIEYLRPLLAQRDDDSPALRVGWLGGACPAASNGRVVFESLDGLMAAEDPQDASFVAPVLAIGARTLSAMQQAPDLATANLLPQSLQQHRLHRASLRAIATIVGCALLGLVLTATALQVAVVRYQAYSADLAAQIAVIRADGEAVGRQLDQLEAVQQARTTRGDFQRVLAGLYEGTPSEVSYNHVELSRDGNLRLRGQADSLSLPFVLPERLEPLTMFQDVVLRDASQSRRGQGSVVEFHMETRLVREEASP